MKVKTFLTGCPGKFYTLSGEVWGVFFDAFDFFFLAFTFFSGVAGVKPMLSTPVSGSGQHWGCWGLAGKQVGVAIPILVLCYPYTWGC